MEDCCGQAQDCGGGNTNMNAHDDAGYSPVNDRLALTHVSRRGMERAIVRLVTIRRRLDHRWPSARRING